MFSKTSKVIVGVGSANPVKVEAVRSLFSHHFKNLNIVAVPVQSVISSQPMSDKETLLGARHRSQEALSAVSGADFGVGIESGMNLEEMGWVEKTIVVITAKDGREGLGHSAGIVLPDGMVKKMQSGQDLGQIIDAAFGTANIGQGIGMIGLLTDKVLTRHSYTEQGIALAFARFLHSEIY